MRFSALLAALVVLAGTVSTEAAPIRVQSRAPSSCPPYSPPAVTPGAKSWPLVSASDDFGFRLFAYQYRHRTAANVFISPTSAALALGMAYAGAQGSTRQGMAAALSLRGIPQPEVGSLAASWVSQLRSGDRKVQLEAANSLWAQQGAGIRASFIDNAARHFGAQVTNLDLQSPAAPVTINAWVDCHTHHKIQKIVDSTAGDVMLLINTLYFHGLWSSPFQRPETFRASFTTGSGARVQVPLMHQVETLSYYQGPNFQAASLPYGRGRFSMVVILPRKGMPLGQFEPSLNLTAWRTITSHLRSTLVSLALPRLQVHNSFSFRNALSTLGMGQAFSSRANFGGMCNGPCVLSDVLQKTYLNVYERGTVAAAVTAVVTAGGGAPIKTVPMIVDHPFILGIRDHKTVAILFLGGINNPK
jgi:serine protease inhibitor